MTVDLPDKAPAVGGEHGNPDKDMFYNDPFLGLFDGALGMDYVGR